ncbi:MAG TPA: dTDP-glucose 4,6-dehydratase [Magnetospirillaceae bacterium]|jgi:dTDP-glucose 4,6-dehydratase
MTTVMVTGGAGFIGSAVVRQYLDETDFNIVNFDKLTYAGTVSSVLQRQAHARYVLVQADICDRAAVDAAFERYRPDAVIHLAAETHVDRSIESPAECIRTNVLGTGTMLSAALAYWKREKSSDARAFRFVHVSTDEVFGSLDAADRFTEASPYAPNSPYAATKAGADHLVRAWHRTYGLPILVANCSNNYGPYQFPEKLIPLTIVRGLAGLPLPIYGTGQNIRDWLYVEDNARALRLLLDRGTVGETFAIGGNSERTNTQVVEAICALLDELAPSADGPRRRLIEYVADRPGHDLRYAIDDAKANRTLGWRAQTSFETGLHATVAWYLQNRPWWQGLLENGGAVERRGLDFGS